MCRLSTIYSEISLVLNIFSATPFSIPYWVYHMSKDMATPFINFTAALLFIKDEIII
jgi:hypothetical protein